MLSYPFSLASVSSSSARHLSLMERKTSRDSMSLSSKSPPGYEPLRNKDVESESLDGLDMLPLHRNQRPRRRRLCTAVKVIGSLLLIATIILTFALSFHAVELLGKIGALVKQPKPTSHYRSFKFPCGQTASEAREKGCIFDVMTMAWQSPECFDEDLNSEFMDLGPWSFYSDQTASRMMTYDEISERGVISWTDRRYFVTHCVFAYKSLHRVWQRGWRTDSNSASSEHMELCARVLSNQSVPLDAITTMIHVDFPSCN